MKTSYRHVGITTNIADWDDEAVDAALRLIQGWRQPNVPADIPGLKAHAAELRAAGYERFPPCGDADERGVCPGHEDGELLLSMPVHTFKVTL